MLVAVLLLEVCVALVSTRSPASTAPLVGSKRPELASESAFAESLKQLNRLRCQLEYMSGQSVCGAGGANLTETEAQQACKRQLRELSVNVPTLMCSLSTHAGYRRPHWDLRRSRECTLATAIWPQLHLLPGGTQASQRNDTQTMCNVRSNSSKCSTPQLWFKKCYPPADRIRSSSSSFATLVTGAYERAATLLLMWKALEFVLNSSAVRLCEVQNSTLQSLQWVQSLVLQLEKRVNLRWIELLCSSHHLAFFTSIDRSLSRLVSNLTALTTTTIAAEQRVERRVEESNLTAFTTTTIAAEQRVEGRVEESNLTAFTTTTIAAEQRVEGSAEKSNLTALTNTTIAAEQRVERRAEEIVAAIVRALENTASENENDEELKLEPAQARTLAPGEKLCRNARRTLRAAARITLAYLGEYELPLVRALENNAAVGTRAF